MYTFTKEKMACYTYKGKTYSREELLAIKNQIIAENSAIFNKKDSEELKEINLILNQLSKNGLASEVIIDNTSGLEQRLENWGVTINNNQDVSFEATSQFTTRDGRNIGFTYDTDKVARERFDIQKLTKIGSGSDRDVYDLGEGKVLKIAKTARGLTQNIYEGDYYLKGIVPEVFERGLNYVVAEKVDSPRKNNQEMYLKYIEDEFEKQGFSIGKQGGMLYIEGVETEEAIGVNDLPKPLQKLVKDYGYLIGDSEYKNRKIDFGSITKKIQEEDTSKIRLDDMLDELKKFSQKDFDNHDSKLQELLEKYDMLDIMSYDVLWGDFIAKRNWGIKEGHPIHLDGGTFGGVRMLNSYRGKTNLSDPEFREIYLKSKQLKKEFGDRDANTMYQIGETPTDNNLSLENKLEYAKEIIEGKAVLNRLPQEIERGRIESGRRNVEATIVSGAGETSDDEEGVGRYERQVKRLEEYAKKEGIWIEDYPRKFGSYIGGGQEQDVYYDGKGYVYKANNLHVHEDDLTTFFDRLAIHQALFPESAYELIGFSRNEDDEFVALVKQPFLPASNKLTDREILDYYKSIGFSPLVSSDADIPITPKGKIELSPEIDETPYTDYSFFNDYVVLLDSHKDNLYKDDEGRIFVIDPILFPNTPSQGYGGKVEIKDVEIPQVQKTNSQIEKIKDYATEVINNRKQIRRLTEEDERGRIEGGIRNVEATLLLATSGGEFGQIEGREAQQKAIEAYAKSEGIWYDNIESSPKLNSAHDRLGIYKDKGMENLVFIPQDNPHIVRKAMRTTDIANKSNPNEVLYHLDTRISQHNAGIGATAPYKVVGFGRLDKGDFVVITEQPHIQDARYATNDEIETVMVKMGFESLGEDAFADDNHYIVDINPKNVLVSKKGTLHFIDTIYDNVYEANEENATDFPLTKDNLNFQINNEENYNRQEWESINEGNGILQQLVADRRIYEGKHEEEDVYDKLWTEYKEKGLVEDNIDERLGEPFANGTESLVWGDAKNKTAIKTMSYDMEGSIAKLLDKIVVHNLFFPETRIDIIGLSKLSDGTRTFIVEQPFVDYDTDKEMSQKEIESFMKTKGFEKASNDEYPVYRKGEYIIKDLHEGNIGYTKGGNIAVVDFFADIDRNNDIRYSSQGVKMIPNGFIRGGKVYLNSDTMSKETPIHEYNHLYNKWLKETRPEVYARGLELIEEEISKGENSAIKDVIDYVEKTQPNLQGEAKKEEILTELLGRDGLKLIEETKGKVKKGSIEEWLSNVWDEIKKMLGLSAMSNEEIMNLTLGEYARAINVDLLSGKKIFESIEPIMEMIGEEYSDYRDMKFSFSLENKENPPLLSNAEREKLFKKAFGETNARLIREKMSKGQEKGQPFIDFLKAKIPFKKDIAYLIDKFSEQLQNDFFANEGIDNTKSNISPQDLLKQLNYEFNEPIKNVDEIESFRFYYEGKGSDMRVGGSIICTYNSPSSRIKDNFIMFLVRDDAKETLRASELTQDNLSDSWKDYLEKKGRKNEDGTYNLRGLEGDKDAREDPFSTSVICVQIPRTGGNAKMISRYNHVGITHGNVDLVYGGDLNSLVSGAESAIYDYLNVSKGKANKKYDDEKVIQDNEGKLFVYGKEEEGVYYGDGFYINNGESFMLNPNTQRMANGVIFNSDGTITALFNTEFSQLFSESEKITFLPNNTIRVKLPSGEIELPIINGIAQQNTYIDIELAIKAYNLFGNVEREKDNITIPYIDNSNYIYYHGDIQSVGGFVSVDGTANLENLQSVGGGVMVYGTANLEAKNLQSVGGFVSVDGTANLENLQSVGGNVRVEGTANLENLQSVGGDVMVYGTANLEAKNLQSVGGFVRVEGTANLENLQSVGGGVMVYGTANLEAKNYTQNDPKNKAKDITKKTNDIFKEAHTKLLSAILNKEKYDLNYFLPKKYKITKKEINFTTLPECI